VVAAEGVVGGGARGGVRVEVDGEGAEAARCGGAEALAAGRVGAGDTCAPEDGEEFVGQAVDGGGFARLSFVFLLLFCLLVLFAESERERERDGGGVGLAAEVLVVAAAGVRRVSAGLSEVLWSEVASASAAAAWRRRRRSLRPASDTMHVLFFKCCCCRRSRDTTKPGP
jgi:hypothetical protein